VGKLSAIVSRIRRPGACCSAPSKARERSFASFVPIFKALGDETRLRIFAYLAEAGEATCVCNIEDYVKELSQPTISHHLRLLREAGLVTTERRGTWIYYSIAPTTRQQLAKFVALLEE
jgi:ArsR family transcriptional regulator